MRDMFNMTAASSEKPLELTVCNFGPIAEARVELRPMSVFVGPSNTGKSYLAVLIYALHRFFNGYAQRPTGRREFGPEFFAAAQLPSRSLALSENDIACLYDWGSKTLPHLGDTEQQDSFSYELPDDVAALVRLVVSRLGSHGGVLDREIVRCFGVDQAASLARYTSQDGAGFSLYNNATNGLRYSSSFSYEVATTGQEANITASIPNDVPLKVEQETHALAHRLSLIPKDNLRKDVAYVILGCAAGDVVANIFGHLTNPAHYLPADRAGVMHAHQVAVRGLIAGASRIGLRADFPMPVLSGVLGDFLEQLVALASDWWYREHGSHNDLALQLEKGLLQGVVRVERSQIDYPSFVYRPDGWERDLSLMNTSSMVSELAPVALYLRHVVEPGDTLIIEEPESHLHPAMQAEFTRLLARAVKAGIRIIITTHSEWVLEELANLVLMSELPVEHRSGIEGADLALTPDEVGAWFFEPDHESGGSVVKEIPLDKEMGKFPSEFGLVTAELYNRFAMISNRIERLKEG
jgi:predicted ATPase